MSCRTKFLFNLPFYINNQNIANYLLKQPHAAVCSLFRQQDYHSPYFYLINRQSLYGLNEHVEFVIVIASFHWPKESMATKLCKNLPLNAAKCDAILPYLSTLVVLAPFWINKFTILHSPEANHYCILLRVSIFTFINYHFQPPNVMPFFHKLYL